jgi:hypothetical protein
MTCDAFYETHSLPHQGGDRCSRHEIESGTARAYSVIGACTTIFGIANLFVTRWAIKRFGVKTALLIQVFWAAVRLLIQNIGAMTGSSRGLLIFQCSQIITVIGGPNGYVLALNSFVTDVTDQEQRTGALGQLQGCMLVGVAVGYLIGGIVGEYFGILAPFRMTLGLFLLCSFYVLALLPAIPRQEDVVAARQTKGITQYLGPLRVFAPQKWTLLDGRTVSHFGTLTLGIGVFLAILATGYIPTMLQMYATNSFGYGTADNAWLIFIYSALRGLFLTLVFPRIIAFGRKWLDSWSGDSKNGVDVGKLQNDEPQNIPTSPAEIGPIDSMDNDAELETPAKRQVEGETYAFDLVYARFSLLADVVLCGLATFSTKGWHLYPVAVFLPLSAGTGSAAKGSVLQMIPSHERVDALSGITLIENVARLSTSKFDFPRVISVTRFQY